MTGSRDFTSAGSDWYQAGVLPADSDEAISLAKADSFLRAYWTDSAGMAVARTMRTEVWTSGLCEACQCAFNWTCFSSGTVERFDDRALLIAGTLRRAQ